MKNIQEINARAIANDTGLNPCAPGMVRTWRILGGEISEEREVEAASWPIGDLQVVLARCANRWVVGVLNLVKDEDAYDTSFYYGSSYTKAVEAYRAKRDEEEQFERVRYFHEGPSLLQLMGSTDW